MLPSGDLTMLPSARRTSLHRASTGSVGVGELEPQAIHVHAQYGAFRSATGDHPAPRGDQGLSETTRVLMKMDSGAGTMGQVWNALCGVGNFR